MFVGPVLKINANQRYATSARTSSVLRYLAEMDSIPLQEVAVRNDGPCGTTVGPIIASTLGIETVDLGIGCLSMHSIRETGCVADVAHGVDLITTFFSKKLPRVTPSA